MKYKFKTKLAECSGFSKSFISRILDDNDPCRPSWDTAKKLGYITDTNPVLWADKDLAVLKRDLEKKEPTELKSAKQFTAA